MQLEHMVSIYCPNCGLKIDVEDKIRWNSVYCKRCKVDLVVHLHDNHIYVKYDTPIQQLTQ